MLLVFHTFVVDICYAVALLHACRIDMKSGVGSQEKSLLCKSEFGESRHSDRL
jgi:hypothetical protein